MSPGATIWTDDPQFAANAKRAVNDGQLRRNLRKATSSIRERRASAVAEMPDWQALRTAGAAIKDEVLLHLDRYLELALEHNLYCAGRKSLRRWTSNVKRKAWRSRARSH